jgi:hypothetical protein
MNIGDEYDWFSSSLILFFLYYLLLLDHPVASFPLFPFFPTSKAMGEKHSFEKPMGGFVQPRNAADTSAIRGHFVAASGEFVGTFMFLLFAFLGHQMSASQQVATAHDGTNSNQTIVFIGMSYGLSLLVTAWTFYRISGGLFRYVCGERSVWCLSY